MRAVVTRVRSASVTIGGRGNGEIGLGYLVLLSALAVFVFYRGLRRYSSSSLMAARM